MTSYGWLISFSCLLLAALPAAAIESVELAALPSKVHLSQSLTIPFEYRDKLLVLKVRLNDSEPMDFLFDTGASDIIVDRRVAADHFLAKRDSFDIAGASAMVTTQASSIDKLQIAKLTLENTPCLIADLSASNRQLSKPVAGLLGGSFMNQFTVTVDFARQVIVLHDPGSYKAPEGVAQVEFALQTGPVVKATLNGQIQHYFLIDTGAQHNHLPYELSVRLLPQAGAVTEALGVDGKPLTLALFTADVVDVGGVKLRKQSFTSPRQASPSQANVQTESGFFKKTNLGVLGNDFWQNFIFTLDFASRRLYLQLSQVQKSRQEVSKLLAAADAALIIQRNYRLAETEYQKALLSARQAQDARDQAVIYGRIGNMRRIMAKDLKRPEQAKLAQEYFTQAQAAARKIKDKKAEGRILADWSLLYSDLGQAIDASRAIESALFLAADDAQVNVDYAVHLYRSNAYAEMQKYIDRALALDSANWQALWYQLKLSELYSDGPKQVETLKVILRRYPFSKLAQEKLSALQAVAK